MRRGLYFMLMVVLVLRGLTGTAMAAGVLPPLLQAHGAEYSQDHGHAADHGQEHSFALPACHGEPTTAACAAQDHHASNCSACEICHSAMLDVPAALTPSPPPPAPLRFLTAAQFDSAPAALVIKPPIT